MLGFLLFVIHILAVGAWNLVRKSIYDDISFEPLHRFSLFLKRWIAENEPCNFIYIENIMKR